MTAIHEAAPPHFSPLVDAGSLIFVSGQLAFDEHGAITGDVSAQTQQCLRAIEKLLQSRGLSRVNVVKATVWLRRTDDFQAFNSSYAEYFGAHRPARSTVICELARPEALVEIEAVAVRSKA